MKRFIIFVIAGVLTGQTVFAQPDSVWSRTFGGEAPKMRVPTAAGNQ